MQSRFGRKASALLPSALLLCAAASIHAASLPARQSLPDSPAPAQRSIEDLNYQSADAAMPPFSDSRIPEQSAFRQGLFRKGLSFRVITGVQYVQNTLNSPVSFDQQVYVGQAPYESTFIQPILVSDLRQLHLQHAQLYMGAVWNWVSWNPAGPKALQLWNLYFYKAFGKDRVELKAGYIANNMNFVGFFVGGSTSSAIQGSYAVLPFEAGMSYFPLTAPAVNLRVHGPRFTYLAVSTQRSLDPNGGPTEVARNHTGFRFIPHGDKLLVISEAGLNRAATTTAHEAWYRFGYLHNATRYTNEATGQLQAGNYCTYVLGDQQISRTSRDYPNEGLYLGASFITVPQSFNGYSRYYEARAYDEAPFRGRHGDIVSVIASRTAYSSVFTNHYLAQGKSVWRAGDSLTGSYSLRASRGSYAGLGLSYFNGPAITPRVPSALSFIANWTLFF